MNGKKAKALRKLAGTYPAQTSTAYQGKPVTDSQGQPYRDRMQVVVKHNCQRGIVKQLKKVLRDYNNNNNRHRTGTTDTSGH